MKKLVLSILTVASLTLMNCSSSDDSDMEPGSTFEVIVDDLRGNITSGTVTLDATKTHTLTGALIVRSGATLNIPAGTKIESSATAAAQSLFIAVERGATINVQGTSTNPVVMTSGKATKAPGDWGGLVICGDAVTNSGANSTSEVGSLKYGGNNNDDSSGSISYLEVAYTGANNGANKEFNGVSFFAVGSGTQINNVYAYESGDDGIEFFGGTADASNLTIINAFDDSLDFADGYSGTITNVYIKGVSKAGIEGSNNGDDTEITPLTDATVVNVSIVKGETPFTASEQAINFKEGGGKQVYTNLFVDGITTAVKVSDDSGATARINAGDFTINGKTFATDKNTVAEYVSNETGAGSGADLPTWAEWTK